LRETKKFNEGISKCREYKAQKLVLLLALYVAVALTAYGKNQMVTFFIAAAVVKIKLVIVAQKCSFVTTGTWRIFSAGGSASPCFGTIRSELVETLAALIFLVTKFIFAITIKFLKVVAFWTRN